MSYEWNLFTYGSCSGGKAGAGIVLEGPEGFVAEFILKFNFPISNNIFEYEAVIRGFLLAEAMGVSNLKVYINSQ